MLSEVFHHEDRIVFPAQTEHARLILVAFLCDHEDERLLRSAQNGNIAEVMALCHTYGVPILFIEEEVM